MTNTFLAAAAFGLEGVAAGELKRMGIPAKAENGAARFEGTWADAYRANLCLRTADRVLLLLAEETVLSFEDLFTAVSRVAWEKYLPADAMVHVTGKCVRSRLMSVRDCQSVTKKAIMNRLAEKLKVSRLPETGAEYVIDAAVTNDTLRVTLDLSGSALNRRGYRTWNGEAPLRETLAAALVDLSPWRRGMRLYDPCCGTGTLLIETAFKASRKPSGMDRAFAMEKYGFLTKEEMNAARQAAAADYQPGAEWEIAGSDIDDEALTLCRRHISQAGFEDRISVEKHDLRQLQLSGEPGVFLLNPPYGERLSDQDGARELYREIGKMWRRHPGWALAAITADPAFERYFGKRADKKRRLYNGRLECDFFIYYPV